MHTGDTQLPIQIHFADDIRRVPPRGLHLTVHRDVRALGDGTQIGHGDGARDVAAVQEARLGYRHQRGGGEIVEERCCGAAVEVAGLVA